MDDRDEWLEGVRRWYFGGEAPAEAVDDEVTWPTGQQPAATDSALRHVASESAFNPRPALG